MNEFKNFCRLKFRLIMFCEVNIATLEFQQKPFTEGIKIFISKLLMLADQPKWTYSHRE